METVAQQPWRPRAEGQVVPRVGTLSGDPGAQTRASTPDDGTTMHSAMPEPGPGVWAPTPHDCHTGQPEGEEMGEQEGGLARGSTAGK